MLIQVNTGSQTHNTAHRTEEVQALIEDKLGRFADRISRAEVHLTDENSTGKTGGHDKKCTIEVRMAGRQPISTTDHGATHDQALHGAAMKMKSQIETIVGKISHGDGYVHGHGQGA
jgi:ribosome-associated translation inhibitor RaiA